MLRIKILKPLIQYSVLSAQYPMMNFGRGESLILGILGRLVHKRLQAQLDGRILLSVVGNTHIGNVSLVLSKLVGNWKPPVTGIQVKGRMLAMPVSPCQPG